jgi:hypothetical protein
VKPGFFSRLAANASRRGFPRQPIGHKKETLSQLFPKYRSIEIELNLPEQIERRI